MSEQHNPTPWTIGNNRCNKGGKSIIAPKNVIVGVCRGDYSRRNDSSLSVDEANARRIVACVNRLAKFTTEDIENPAIDLFGTSELQQKIWHVERRNNELLAAAKLLRDKLTPILKTNSSFGQEFADICRAIAKAESC